MKVIAFSNILKALLLIGFFLVAAPVLKADDANQENSTEEQLKGYQPMTNWLIDNKKSFEDIIKENAVETETKWFVEEEYTAKAKKQVEQGGAAPTQVQAAPQTQKLYHLVKKGDTLYSISKTYNIPQADILKWNNLSGAEGIQLDKVLTLYDVEKYNAEQEAIKNGTAPVVAPAAKEDSQPTAEAAPAAPTTEEETMSADSFPEYKYYRVQKGDTFNSIAKIHYMSKDELFALNNFDATSVLSVDQIVKVKSNYGGNKTQQDASGIVKDGFIWPVVGRLLMTFGTQEQGLMNEGINIAAKKGTDVKATQEGIVIYVGDSLKSFGNMVLVQHDKNWISAYAHLGVVKVNKGQKVLKGEVIGQVGDSGSVNTPQLHFELRYNIKPVDPLNYLVSYR
ncbi:MAG: M23 family metallopeptidase [Alphaproteobacteria bacterium]|jgi:murein DD-endopeptidase MepM/ murein hydrolase activator NlpD|nr:M23 family metallopeptidase [Alphaproteobacteria bacterium]